MAKLTLKPEQDGSGYFYGQFIGDDDSVVRVDVVPPRSHPRPYFVMDNDHMHATDRIVFADGQEIARVKQREDIDTLDIVKLLPSN